MVMRSGLSSSLRNFPGCDVSLRSSECRQGTGYFWKEDETMQVSGRRPETCTSDSRLEETPRPLTARGYSEC